MWRNRLLECLPDYVLSSLLGRSSGHIWFFFSLLIVFEARRPYCLQRPGHIALAVDTAYSSDS